MKLIASGDTFSAAIVRSPSFSRSSSSQTMIMRPCLKASTASSMRANGLPDLRAPLAIFICCGLLALGFGIFDLSDGEPGELDGARDVLPHHIAFDVHGVAILRGLQIRVLDRTRSYN